MRLLRALLSKRPTAGPVPPGGPVMGQRYEVVFCIFLVALAFLYRDNHHLVYPQILYLLVVLLSLNLLAEFVLRRWPSRDGVSAFITLGNCAVITAALRYSGG